MRERARSLLPPGKRSVGDKLKLEHPYICGDCAQKHGGKWPEGHVATFHMGMCEYCRATKGLANVGDWNWPDGVRRGLRD